MRITIELPDVLFRKAKGCAALRGKSMKELIVAALEKELGVTPSNEAKQVDLPLVRLPHGKKLQLKDLDFDEVIA